MIVNKIVINRLASAKSFLQTVPETDSILAQFPAKAHRLPLVVREKVDQADVDVLDQSAGLLHAIGCVLQRSGAGIAAGAHGEVGAGIDSRTSRHADALGVVFQVFMSFLILGAMKEDVF